MRIDMSYKFEERPNLNEKEKSALYIKNLITLAKKEQRVDDVEQLAKILRLIDTKKYGLVWEEHAENVFEEMQENIPVFVENKEKTFCGDPKNDSFNFLLEGDNLHSLHLLEKTHYGKINVIYIDPPYNTRNKDFKYNDTFVNVNDNFVHSKWLSFMNARLKKAWNLLAEDGVIFISIDNKEQAQLKLLCDEVFGEKNFVTTIHVELSATQGMKVKSAKNGNIVKNGEYIHVYSKKETKNISKNILYDLRPEYDDHYSKFLQTDNTIHNLLDVFFEEYPDEKNKHKKIKINSLYDTSPKFREFVKINKNKIFRFDKTTGFSLEDFPENEVVHLIKNDREYTLLRKKTSVEQLMFLSASFGETHGFKPIEGLRKIRGDWWKNFYLDMGNVSKEGNVVFANGKKPVRLIKQLIYMVSNKNDTILDFFAGSGTTGHAVIELNAEDGLNRNFILATNDEVIETTYKRLSNVNEISPYNMKYFNTDFVKKNEFPDDLLEYKLLEYVTPLVELQFGIDIENPKVQIVLQDEQMETIVDKDLLQNESIIFIHPDVFLDNVQKSYINQHQIKIKEIPNYFFGKDMWQK